MVSLEKEERKNWRIFGNEKSESLGMKGIIMIFLKEKKIKNLEELESLWK